MDVVRWQRVQDILDDAVDLRGAERKRFLDEACGGDRELLWDVERLLAFEEAPGEKLARAAWTPTEDSGTDDEQATGSTSPDPELGQPKHRHPAHLDPGDRIGPYRIERLLGAGGMGEVYLAIREDDFEQRVAIKRVSATVTGRDVDAQGIRARFLHERQILANLQHPMISRLLDGGTTEDGQPYLVMDYVEGEPIDAYCERHGLALRARIELFRKVCEVVHYAHQNLIVHRDLKASNILVSEDGTPYLLDFGIAKLLEPENIPGHFATVQGTAPMTPAYASPEQFLNETITTACDLYALGVLLYKLLTGRMPYRIVGASYAQLVRRICVADPLRPSQREELSRRRRLRLRGDLDAIVMKALRKEPGERYNSAALLSQDLRCHLEGLPVTARKGSWRYYSGKFVRRNKLVLAVALLITLSAITSTALWLQAERERHEAERLKNRAELQQARAELQQARAERLVELMRDLFKSAEPERARGEEVTVREVLEEGRVEIDENLADEPALYAEMLGTLGTVYGSLGLYDEALEAKEAALAAARDAYAGDHVEVAKHLNNLANARYRKGDYAPAVELMREVLTMRQRLGVPSHELATAMANLASTLLRRGELEEAEEHARRALAIRREHFGPQSHEVASSLYLLGAIEADRGELESAEAHYREALRLRSRHFGEASLKVAQVLASLGNVLHAQSRLGEAWRVYEEALAIRIGLEGAEHPNSLGLQRRYALLLLEAGEQERGCELAGAILDRQRGNGVSPGELAHVETMARNCPVVRH